RRSSGRVKAQGDNYQYYDREGNLYKEHQADRLNKYATLLIMGDERGSDGAKLLSPLTMQMTEQDTVMRLTGSWDTLGIVAKNVSFKLSYQFLSWMQIDNGDGSTPQYISEHDAVEAFVQMRCKIEEVNLFVTISEHIDGITTSKTRPPFANVTDQALILNEAEIENASDDILEDAWLDFAMFETPLTCPQQKNDGTNVAATCSSFSNNGVGGGNGESSRAVRRRLFEDPMEANNAAIGRDGQTETQADPIESPTTAEPSGVAQQSSLYTWTRFQDLLHDLLNDESTEPVLFARDAAPVIDSGEVDG
ncbi:unnamed protein product, partial [Brassica rapa subsp. trilocularis]